MPGNRTLAWTPEEDAAPDDDALLSVRAGEGDDEAFAVLVRRHAPTLVRLATRLVDDRTEAEDIVQEAFISAWRKLPEFRGQSSFGTWLYRIVTNRCLNVLRARKPQTQLENAPEAPAPEHTVAPDRITEARAAVADLHQALTRLSAEQRTCWVLRELDGRSYAFIADTVGITEQAVRARVFRARRQLTDTLGAWR
ncbi:RNA polymerase sigma factor [Streptomyces sp. NPDC003952]